MTYQDVLCCPTYERRFYLQMLINEANRKNELIEEAQQARASSGGRGSRNTRISGDQLKAKLQSGQIPND